MNEKQFVLRIHGKPYRFQASVLVVGLIMELAETAKQQQDALHLYQTIQDGVTRGQIKRLGLGVSDHV